MTFKEAVELPVVVYSLAEMCVIGSEPVWRQCDYMDSIDFLTLLSTSVIKFYAYVLMFECMRLISTR